MLLHPSTPGVFDLPKKLRRKSVSCFTVITTTTVLKVSWYLPSEQVHKEKQLRRLVPTVILGPQPL